MSLNKSVTQTIRPREINAEEVMTVQRTLPAGETYVIGSNESMVVAGDFEINGDLEVEPNGVFAVV